MTKPQQAPSHWDRQADVVVIGSGAAGMPAAIVAREAGASVIVVEAEPHIGGHAITSGGNLPLGGGTRYQKKYGIEDSPELFFRDLTDWSVVENNGFPPYRYNDREIIHAFADNSVAAFEFLLAHGVRVIDRPPNNIGHEIGVSVPRTMQIDVADWPMVHTGKPADPNDPEIRAGAGLIRPLEAAARKAGVEILLEHRMTAIHREAPRRGRVLGIAVDHKGAIRKRAQSGRRHDRRLDRQRQFPLHVRPATHGRILRARRHAVVRSGRQRRARRHGHWRRALGTVQLHR